MKTLKLLCLLLLSLLTKEIYACAFDTDCDVGSECVKEGGDLYGICVGGMSPGNDNDQVPVEDPLDIDRSYGDTCSFDVDCGISNKCYKEPGNIDGVCVKGR